jgi:L-seryl-tRNA(Ser) seleniumtransferase
MELEEKAGAAIARMVDVPAAYITSGAGSALMLATAAAMAGDDDDNIQQLPNTSGMKDEILIQTRQRYWYDRCLELAGAKLVMFGSEEQTTKEDLEKAIGPNTAAVHYYAVEQAIDPLALTLEDTIEVAHAHGVLVTVDAAGQIYPLENFGKYVRMGADFQCIAAKYLGATQSVGLALGSEEMIRKIGLHAFASYEGRRVRGVGRPQKVDRQEMVGAVAAVKHWMTMNHEDRLADTEQRTRVILGLVSGIPGLRAEMIENVIGHQPYGLNIWVDKTVAGFDVYELRDKLRDGDPPIWTRVRDEDDYITIHMFGLNPGEDRIVGERIAALFQK